MGWNHLTIGKKIAIGFSIVIFLLLVLGGLSFTGVSGMVGKAKGVIDGNTLDGQLAQKELDHLNWANRVNALLTDATVKTLDVETDHHKCAFGKWLYGDGRRQAEMLVPSLAPLFKAIEKPHQALHESAVSIGKVFRPADPGLPALLGERETDHLKWASKIRDVFVRKQDTLGVATDPAQCALGKWLQSEEALKIYQSGDPDFKKAWDEMVQAHQELHVSAAGIEEHLAFGKLVQLKQTRDKLEQEFDELGRTFFATLAEAMEKAIDPAKEKAEQSKNITLLAHWGGIDMVMNEKVIQPFLSARLAMSRFAASKSDPDWAAYQDRVGTFGAGLDDWKKLCKGEPVLEKTLTRLDHLSGTWTGKAAAFRQAIVQENEAQASILKALEIYDTNTLPKLDKSLGLLGKLKEEALHEVAGMREAQRLYAAQTTPALKEVQQLLGDIRKEAKHHVMTDEALLDTASGTRRSISITTVAAVFAGVFLAFVIARGIISALTGISDGLREGANQVAAAAGQVSSASQSLAEGSSRQASALEETSASMEEMSSMTLKNAENAGLANSLMKEANGIVSQANESMGELTISMIDISKASEETSKIIKTIDEIAFQTNLLALNAAVEAARAGEAGAGFAVVADEVRNLAMRAAGAAKETAQLIEDTVKKVEKGSQIVSETSQAFDKIARSTGKVGGLVSEIAEASREQSEGIGQVNKAIMEMDHVVQQNAADAEESASASEEMNAQAGQLRDYVGELMIMVNGAGDGKKIENPVKRIALPRPGPVKTIRLPEKKLPAKKTNEVRADEIIPVDGDDDFKDFNHILRMRK